MKQPTAALNELFYDYQQQGTEDFNHLNWPSRKNESWRFSQPNTLIINDYNIPESVDNHITKTVLSKTHPYENLSGHIIFIDGHLVQKTIAPEIQENSQLLFLSLEEAITQHPVLFKNYYFKNNPSMGSEKLLSLHQMHAGCGTFIHIPENVQIKAPFLIEYWCSKDNSLIAPHTLIIGKANSNLNVIESYESLGRDRAHFSCAVSHTYAENNAHIFKKSLQSLNHKSRSVQIDAAWAAKNATINNVSLHLGGYYNRFENQAFLTGENSHIQLAALTIADDHQIFDQRSLQIHEAPSATSDLLYKNALKNEATTIFSGMILVKPGAQKTDAYQTNRNLLLSHEAEAIALPGLEIEANDVKCSHGATTAPIDDEALFYLKTRGIPQQQAEKLLIFGFFEEVLLRLNSPAMIENIKTQIEKKYATDPSSLP